MDDQNDYLIKHEIEINALKGELSELKPILKEMSNTLTKLAVNSVELDRLRKDVDKMSANIERIFQQMEKIKIDTNDNSKSVANASKIGFIVFTALFSFFIWYIKEIPTSQPAPTAISASKTGGP